MELIRRESIIRKSDFKNLKSFEKGKTLTTVGFSVLQDQNIETGLFGIYYAFDINFPDGGTVNIVIEVRFYFKNQREAPPLQTLWEYAQESLQEIALRFNDEFRNKGIGIDQNVMKPAELNEMEVKHEIAIEIERAYPSKKPPRW